MDPEFAVIEDRAIVVRDGTIVALGKKQALDDQWECSRHLGGSDQIVLPGLINTHTHIPMALFRGVADDRSLIDWLHNFIWPLEKNWLIQSLFTGGLCLGYGRCFAPGQQHLSILTFMKMLLQAQQKK